MQAPVVDACKAKLAGANLVAGCLPLLGMVLRKGHAGITSLQPSMFAQYMHKGRIDTVDARWLVVEALQYHYHGSADLPAVALALMGVGVGREAANAWFVCVAGIAVLCDGDLCIGLDGSVMVA